MTMRHIYNKGIIMVVALLSLASCVKDDLYDMPGPGSDPGNDAKLVVKPDYSAMSMDAVIPPACRLAIDDYDVYDETDKAQFEIPVTYGSHDLLAYSLPEGISVSGEIAWVNARGGEIEPQPGYLFASAMQVDVKPNGEQTVTMPMRQLVRLIKLNMIESGGNGDVHVASVTGTLDGVATSVNMVTGELSDQVASVSDRFEQSGKEFYLHFRILGVVPTERQMLTVHITYSNGEEQTIESDLTDELDDFDEEREPLLLNGELSLPVEAGAGGELSPWVTVDGGDGDAV